MLKAWELSSISRAKLLASGRTLSLLGIIAGLGLFGSGCEETSQTVAEGQRLQKVLIGKPASNKNAAIAEVQPVAPALPLLVLETQWANPLVPRPNPSTLPIITPGPACSAENQASWLQAASNPEICASNDDCDSGGLCILSPGANGASDPTGSWKPNSNPPTTQAKEISLFTCAPRLHDPNADPGSAYQSLAMLPPPWTSITYYKVPKAIHQGCTNDSEWIDEQYTSAAPAPPPPNCSLGADSLESNAGNVEKCKKISPQCVWTVTEPAGQGNLKPRGECRLGTPPNPAPAPVFGATDTLFTGCSTSSQCSSGQVCLKKYRWNPIGYCTKPCQSRSGCPMNTACRTYNTPVRGYLTSVCVPPFPADEPPLPAGYFCPDGSARSDNQPCPANAATPQSVCEVSGGSWSGSACSCAAKPLSSLNNGACTCTYGSNPLNSTCPSQAQAECQSRGNKWQWNSSNNTCGCAPGHSLTGGQCINIDPGATRDLPPGW